MDWRFVKQLQRMPFFHYASYVVIGVPILSEAFLFFRSQGARLELPRVLALGFTASVLYVFSAVVYHNRCPRSVRDFADEQAFATEQLSSYELSQRQRKLHIVLANLEDSEDDIRSNLLVLVRNDQPEEMDGKLNELYPMALQRYLMKQYQRDMLEHRKSMWFAALLHFAG